MILWCTLLRVSDEHNCDCELLASSGADHWMRNCLLSPVVFRISRMSLASLLMSRLARDRFVIFDVGDLPPDDDDAGFDEPL